MQSCIFLGEVQFFLGRDLTVLVTLIDKKHNNYIENTILYMCTTCTSSNCKKTRPTLPRSAQRRMCSGHLLTSRAQGDVWYTNYSVWTEPWKPGLKFNLFFCNFVFLLRSCSRVIECLCSLYLHVKTNIGSDSNMFATCMLHVLSCKTFRTGHKGVGIPNKILHWNVSWWLY